MRDPGLLWSQSMVPNLLWTLLSYPCKIKLSYPILSYPILPYPTLPYPILSYPILSVFPETTTVVCP